VAEASNERVAKLPADFVAKYKALGDGMLFDVWVHDMTRDELMAAIGCLLEEREHMRKQHSGDLDFLCGRPRRG
jgi:DNA-binding ferritin-like protein (Dps family)